MAGFDEPQLFESSTSIMMAAFGRRQNEGIGRNYSACGAVRTLCKTGQLKEALQILNQRVILADCNIYVCLLQECIKMKGLAEGKQVHAHIIQSGFKPSFFLLTSLVNMYAKCGSVSDARAVFDKMPERDMFAWTVMIAGYAKHGCGREALDLYQRMLHEGLVPNRVTFICVLNACAGVAALEKGKEVHAHIMRAGIVPDIILETALANMYAKCGNMMDARQVFDGMSERNVVSWTALIAGYAQHGCGKEALEVYEQMTREGLTADRVTYICVLNACASLTSLENGKQVHADISKAGVAQDIILGTALVDMYAKCGSVDDARQVFDNMAERNVVSWNAMIAGYGQQGCGREALEMYEQMTEEGVMPDKVTYICVLNACASLAALENGKEVHADISKAGIVPDIILESALVDMYAKCGSIEDARQVFDIMSHRDLASWNALMVGYAQNGCGREALKLYEQMQQEGLKPNNVTFTCLLSACSHVGLVDEGRYYFGSMSCDYGLTPTMEHFGCMVDLLGRAGQVTEAEEFIIQMPVKPDASVWGALLGACRIHGDVERAERMVNCFVKWDGQYVSTSMHTYAAAGR